MVPALVAGEAVASVYCSPSLVGWHHKDHHFFLAATGGSLQIEHSPLLEEVLLAGSIQTLLLLRDSSLEEFSEAPVIILGTIQPLIGELNGWFTLLGNNPMAVGQVLHLLSCISQLKHLQDYLLLVSFMFLGEARVGNLCPCFGRVTDVCQELAHRVTV